MTTSVMNHIGGRPVPAADGRTFPDENPATGETIAEIARSGPEDVDAAVRFGMRLVDDCEDVLPLLEAIG